MATAKVLTPLFRADFVSLLKPKKKKPGDENKPDIYEVTMIFDPEVAQTDQFKRMEALIDDALFEKWGNKPPSYFRHPIRPGVQKTRQNPDGFDLDKYPQYAGKIIVAARSYGQKAGIVDANGDIMIDASPNEIYSGMYGRATVVAYGYDNEGGVGVAFGLQHFQKCMDGDPLGGARGTAEGEFEAFAQPAQQGNNSHLLGGAQQQPKSNPLAALGI